MLRGWMLGAVVIFGGTPTPVFAQQFPSRQELSQSRWNSTYTTPGGEAVDAVISFNGQSGSYRTSFGTGRLYDIQYGVDTQTNPGNPFFQITGSWSFLGEEGRFTLASRGANRFSGTWNGSIGTGRWTGTRLGNQPQGGGGGGGAVVYDADWSYNDGKGYYYKRCRFPQGGYQYIIWYSEKPEWIYWYNPAKQVTWCACPTVRHPDFGDQVRNGEDLFLMASEKARDPKDATFPDDDGANFKSGATATDSDGSTVSLGCPPTDLP
jgi:hypothetical protein